jgi:hypothetical protein
MLVEGILGGSGFDFAEEISDEKDIDLSTRFVITWSSYGSTNGIGTNAKLNSPSGVSLPGDGSFALVADRDNHRIRHVTSPPARWVIWWLC